MKKMSLQSKLTVIFAVIGIIFLVVSIFNWKELAESIFHMGIQPWGDLSAAESVNLIGHYWNWSLSLAVSGIISLIIAIWLRI